MIGDMSVSNFTKATRFTMVLVAAIVFVIVYLLVQVLFKRKSVSQFPHLAKCMPVLGPVYWVLLAYKKGVWQTWEGIINDHPNGFHLWLFSHLWIILTQPKDVEAVFLSDNAVDKGDIYSFFGNKSEGIFIAEGDNWRKLRGLLNPSFHTKLLAQFLEKMVEKADILVKLLESEVDKTIDIKDYTGRWTLDVICGTQMGVKTYELEDNKYDFLASSEKITGLVLHRMFCPILHPNLIYKSTNLYKEIQKFCKPMHNFAKMIIHKRKEHLETTCNNIEEKKEQIYLDGVLTYFVDADERSLIRKVTDILIAGSDTTQIASSYVIMLLGMYPEIQEKVYQEQCEIMSKHTSQYSISSLARMKYLEMVIKEVLRLYTVPGIVRKVTTPLTLENGDTLPAGCSVYISIYKLHRNPEHWSHPNEFYPDHFLPENVAKRPKYCYIPFSTGPRNCPGMVFAYLSMKTLLAHIVRNYVIHSDSKLNEFKHKMCLMLELENGYPIKLKKRQK